MNTLEDGDGNADTGTSSGGGAVTVWGLLLLALLGLFRNRHDRSRAGRYEQLLLRR
ncbi:MAG: GlyGly-CTERM sorting domain-containing protein [Candidatus Thiodiazotropha sp.]